MIPECRARRDGSTGSRGLWELTPELRPETTMPTSRRDAARQPSRAFAVTPAGEEPTACDAERVAHAVAHTFAAMINVDVVGADALHLRHANGQLGLLTAADILDGRLRVVDTRTRETVTYEHIEAMVVAGWSVIV